MKETSFGNPASAFHQFLVHDGNLSRWAAKTDEAEFEPETERFPEADGRWRSCQGGSMLSGYRFQIPSSLVESRTLATAQFIETG